MKSLFKRASLSLFSSAVLLFLGAMGGFALFNLQGSYDKLLKAGTVQSFRENLGRELMEHLPGRFGFVDLNGAYCRMSGFRLCNRRMRYRNGMLGRPYDNFRERIPADVPAQIRRAAAASHRLGIPFLFVLAPCKIDWEGRLFPAGWQGGNPNRAGSRVAELLAGEGVHVLNLVREFANTMEDVTANFFETDHHWRYEAALRATRMVVGELAEMLPDESLVDHQNLRDGNWRWRNEGRCFLGSHGRKVGRYFCGYSDFRYCLPRYKTSICRRNVSRGKTYRGSFAKAEIQDGALKVRNPYRANKYGIYTGPDVGLQVHENFLASDSRCLMIVKDSFGDPVSAFLATVFKTVVQVDPRRLPKGESAEHLIKVKRPDIVVWLCNSSTLFAGDERRR